MKSFAVFLFVVEAVLLQTVYSQVIRSFAPIGGCGCGSNVISSAPYVTSVSPVVASPTVVAAPSVANTLADTLSLLTVSSLLADTLPLNYNVIAAPSCGCGSKCGLGLGYGTCGCGGYSYVL